MSGLPRFQTKTFLLGGNAANHCTTVLAEFSYYFKGEILKNDQLISNSFSGDNNRVGVQASEIPGSKCTRGEDSNRVAGLVLVILPNQIF